MIYPAMKQPHSFCAIPVTRNSFFAAMGPLNVHPFIISSGYDEKHGYTRVWKMLDDHKAVGCSNDEQCCVTEEFYKQHKDILSLLQRQVKP